MLEVKNLNAYYGKSHILQGVTLNIKQGEIVSLLGRNGVGRSTAIKSIMGMVDIEGSILFNGLEIVGKKIHQISNLGIGYVSENREIFPDLTVLENLELGKKSENKEDWDIEEFFDLNGSGALTNSVTHINIDKNATVNHDRIVNMNSENYHFGQISFDLCENARLNSNSLVIGGQMTRVDLSVNLNKIGSECDLKGLYL